MVLISTTPGVYSQRSLGLVANRNGGRYRGSLEVDDP